MSLRLDDVAFAYTDEPVLDGVDLEVMVGTSVFLLGPSGCGKSTLLRCVAGMERQLSGSIHLDGRRLDDVPAHERRVGYMFQEPALFPHLDVAGNVAFGIRYRTDPPEDESEEVQRHLELVDLDHKASARVDELSGGQRQRVALARTLAAGPRAVLLDEPLSALDRELRDELGDRIKALLARAAVPALWVTHDHQEADRLADRTYRMQDGRVLMHKDTTPDG